MTTVVQTEYHSGTPDTALSNFGNTSTVGLRRIYESVAVFFFFFFVIS